MKKVLAAVALLVGCGQVTNVAETSETSNSDDLAISCGDAACGIVDCTWDYRPTWTGGEPTIYCECLPGTSSVGPYPRCNPEGDPQPPRS